MNSKQWSRIAKNYHAEIISPFYGEVENPILSELDNIKGRKRKSVAEFGCGYFYLGKTLADMFKEVHASDFCGGMVDRAKKINEFHNVGIYEEDITEIKHKDKYDVVISVNSIIMPSLTERKKAYHNIYRSLKKGGSLFLILPSMESVLYHGMLLFDRESGKRDEGNAKTSAKLQFENNKYDFFLGLYKDGSEVQKFYYKHEIEYFLRKAGFVDIEFSKVKYPWGKEVSDYADFPKEKRLWDWFVKCGKK